MIFGDESLFKVGCWGYRIRFGIERSSKNHPIPIILWILKAPIVWPARLFFDVLCHLLNITCIIWNICSIFSPKMSYFGMSWIQWERRLRALGTMWIQKSAFHMCQDVLDIPKAPYDLSKHLCEAKAPLRL